MSKESYARGFVKAAAVAGVDPIALAKFATEIIPLENTEAMFNNAIGGYKKPPIDLKVGDIAGKAADRMYQKIWRHNYAAANDMRGLGADAVTDRFMPRGTRERSVFDALMRKRELTSPNLTILEDLAAKDPESAQNFKDMITMSLIKKRMGGGKDSPWELLPELGSPVPGSTTSYPVAKARRGEVAKILRSYGYPKPAKAAPAVANAAKAAPAVAKNIGILSRIGRLFRRK